MPDFSQGLPEFYVFDAQGRSINLRVRQIGQDERAVLDVLLRRPGTKITIGHLVAALPTLGAHTVHEEQRKRTTPRRMYQLIRNLRDGGYPVVGDAKGLWIASKVSEIEDFADHLERKARADIASMLWLRRAMLEMIASKTPSLFDRLPLSPRDINGATLTSPA